MTTYYHVCIKWDGGDLVSLYDQHGTTAYDLYSERWPDARELCFYHAHYVHLHATAEEAVEYADRFGGDVLEVIDPDNILEVVVDNLEYPHPVTRAIPATLIRPYAV